MGSESQASVPSARRRSVMLFRRARTVLVAVGVFWLWMLFFSASAVASLFDRPFYAMMALYALGALTLISLLVAPVALSYLLMNRPPKPASSAARPSGPARLALLVEQLRSGVAARSIRPQRPAGPARPAGPVQPGAPARSGAPARPETGPRTHEPHRSVRSDLAPVIKMIPRRVKDSGSALGSRAAAKWRDLAS
ncbi:hypothetical protein LOC59_00690 [Arthrobacter sp. zg-Y916]|uniref:hypothetical protein n=1 Tax=Arthrobacter sp. zg-Y916 TaxID=2894190 RepID=UPI001E5764E8|nr:hypothetical protein [Arthrobacter sp. zg-Y916]MCC9192171.1 hypothetical protein [Arthrobacter sp. zg-Y916]